MDEEIDDATMETYLKASNDWMVGRGFAPSDMETYKKVRKVIIDGMKGQLEGYRKLGSVGVTFSDEQKEMIQKSLKKEQK